MKRISDIVYHMAEYKRIIEALLTKDTAENVEQKQLEIIEIIFIN